MARTVKKLTLAEIKTKKKIIVRTLNSLLAELDRASADALNPWCGPEEDWIEETFFNDNGVFHVLDELTQKIRKYR